METRYIAVRLTGDGPGEIVHTEVPLAGVSVTDVLSGPPEGGGKVLPKDRNLLGTDKLPLFGPDQEWGLAIFAEVDGELLDEGGIMTECVEQTDGSYQIALDGMSYYPHDTPYTDTVSFSHEDSLNIYRHIWEHIQGEPGGNLGLTVDPALSGVPIGGLGDDGPLLLNWWSTHNLGSVIDDLATQTPFDWHEMHAWDGEQIKHHIELGVPKIGHRREDGELVVGENVRVRPTYASGGPEYASDIMVLGAGEGRAMITGHNGRRTGKLRRVKVVSDASIRDNFSATNRATRELGLRTTLPTISSIDVASTPGFPVLSYRVGDEVPFIDPLNELMIYVRILSRTLDPATADRATLSVARTDVGVL